MSFLDRSHLALQNLGIRLATIPAGVFVMGSAGNYRKDTPPHWVELSSFSIGTTTTTEAQYRALIGASRNPERPEKHPVIDVSWNDAMEFCRRLTEDLRVLIRLPTEAQWEFAARGPAVNLYEAMEQEGIRPDERADRFPDFVEQRFENFVQEIRLGARIFTDPTDEELRRLLREGRSLYAWRVHGTPSGRWNREEAWFVPIEGDETHDDDDLTVPADWGPANAHGLKCMSGNVWEWVYDWYDETYYDRSPVRDPQGPETGAYCGLRGRSWYYLDFYPTGVAFRNNEYPNAYLGSDGITGFRIAALPRDDGSVLDFP